MPSAKTAVIEHLFYVTKGFARGQALVDPVVRSTEIAAAIRVTNPAWVAQGGRPLSTDNIANFWKDIIRGSPNSYWPARVLSDGFTGDDAIGVGRGAKFVFTPLPPGQTAAFVDVSPSGPAVTNGILLESVSMPLATKALGRTDENWLAQVGVRLRVIESHFALRSMTSVDEVTFLQTGVKLNLGEVDAAYSLVDGADTWLVAVEAKSRRERIHVPQILRAAAQLLLDARTRRQQIAGVIPMAVKVLGPSQLHVVEFDPDTGAGSTGAVVVDSVIELKPPVTGIG